jgi:peptide/nickel transport system substrate-binding protein
MGIAAAAVLSVSALSMGIGGAGGVNAATAPQRGGTLIQGVGTQWSGNFMPYISSTEYDIDIWGNQFLSILGTTPRGQVTTYGGAVDKYTVSKDKKTFTFWLNPKARWSDGRRVTARDVQFGLEWVTDAAYVTTLGGPYAGSWTDIVGSSLPNGNPLPNGTAPSGFKILGKYEFSITITKPYANALLSQLSGIVPLPYFALHQYPFQDWDKIAFNHMPNIGDGPYVISKIIPGEVVLQTANKYFEYGPPLIPTYEWKYVLEKLKPGALLKGIINYTGVEAKYFLQLKSVPTLTAKAVTGLGYAYIGWRLNNSVYGKEFDNVHFRRGVMYALNRPALNQAYNKGLGTVETGPLPDVYSWYDAAANTGKYAYSYSVANAMREFREAGLVLNKKTGWFQLANGQPFDPTFTYSSGSTVLEQESTSIAQYLHAAHLNLKLNPPTDFNTIISQLGNDANGKQPIQGFFLGLGISTDPSFMSTIGNQSSFNLTSWDITNQTLPDFQPEDMKLLAEQKSPAAFSKAYRKKILDQWQMLFSAYLPYEILNDGDSLYVYAKDLKGIVVSPFGAFYDWKWYFSNSN